MKTYPKQLDSTHPKGSDAHVLLTSVFGPYAQDDEYGSRSINPMELYHNQVTRVQGEFSLRMFHRSWGIMMIQENISAPSTLLDFPTRERFEAELKSHAYDIVGISSIVVNIGKVREMCRMVRKISPQSVIVVGGHVTAIPGIERMIDADYIVRGDGIAWMRRYLGEGESAPIRHPPIRSGFGHRTMGLRLPRRLLSPAATIISSVGCPLGCNFCTTSAFFGGKGKFLNFYETGDKLYELMEDFERRLRVHSFFMMDENFLLYRRRAMQLLECMERGGKSWDLYVFSSANAIRKYAVEELVAMGISWIWLGLESPNSSYAKLQGTDTRELARELRAHGIKLLGSTIVGLEHHTPENIEEEIDYAVSHETDFHQFMLYTPVPGTPLYSKMDEQRKLLDVDLSDIHGQFQFNFEHPAISREDSKKYLDRAFWRDFERNGPSLYRVCRTALDGWKRYKHHANERIRRRFQRDAAALKSAYGGMLWAIERQLKWSNAEISRRVRDLRREIGMEFGIWTRLASCAVGSLLLWTARRERKRLERGQTYEPKTFVERRNWVSG
ncbi:MAG: cobalamin-dependent protein [Bryobacteraceae bacterium]|nr:cobalamin-dependent protein [Bryobacteraceae bacterium]